LGKKEAAWRCEMRRLKGTFFSTGIVLLLLGILTGCGIGEEKYVGTYISEDGRMILELKREGIYRFETKGMFPHTTTGEWKVMEYRDEEIISFVPFLPLVHEESRRKGHYFYHPLSGDILVKQR
jgi:hypothetical protein